MNTKTDNAILKQIILANIIFLGSVLVADIEDNEPKFSKLKEINRDILIMLFSQAADKEAAKIVDIITNDVDLNLEEFMGTATKESIDKILNDILMYYSIPQPQIVI